jgi:hypothetical protein
MESCLCWDFAEEFAECLGADNGGIAEVFEFLSRVSLLVKAS